MKNVINFYGRKQVIIFSFILVAIFIASSSFTYAYFEQNVEGNDITSDQVITAGTLNMTYDGGPSITATDIFPGQTFSKIFSVTNTGSLDAFYLIGWSSLTNTFTNNELVVSYTCKQYTNYGLGTQAEVGSCPGTIDVPVGTSVSSVIKSNLMIKPGYTQVYTIDITFIETSSNQNYNQNKSFGGSLEVRESENKMTLLNAMLSSNTPVSDSGIDFLTASDNTTSGLYYTSNLTRTEDLDNDGIGEKVYYYRGNVSNNFVLIGQNCFRIIRSNENGSVRLRYSGQLTNDGCALSGDTLAITDAKFNVVQTNNAYAGFMYGATSGATYELVHANTNSSNAKIVLEAWYTGTDTSGTECDGGTCSFSSITNPMSNYSSLIEDSVFCNDRSITAGTGIGTDSDTRYGANTRLTAGTPQYKCPQANDKFSVSSSVGNGALTNPVGLLTADELMYSGLNNATINESNFLFTGYWYWTMTPSLYGSSGVKNIRLDGDGMYGENYVHGNYGIIPVISIKESIKIISGTGTATDPYVIG